MKNFLLCHDSLHVLKIRSPCSASRDSFPNPFKISASKGQRIQVFKKEFDTSNAFSTLDQFFPDHNDTNGLVDQRIFLRTFATFLSNRWGPVWTDFHAQVPQVFIKAYAQSKNFFRCFGVLQIIHEKNWALKALQFDISGESILRATQKKKSSKICLAKSLEILRVAAEIKTVINLIV